MNDFCITCATGITYTNLENLLYDMDNNADRFTQENIEYLNNYIWETIEETKGKIPCGMLEIMEEIDFIYDYTVDRVTLNSDLYKGWSNELVILLSPISEKHYGIRAITGRYGNTEYEEPLFQVRKTEEVVTVWKTVDDVDDDKSVEVKILKDYLKQAVKDLNRSNDSVDSCEHSCHNCLHDINDDCTHDCRYKWKYTDIVERMLGERIK